MHVGDPAVPVPVADQVGAHVCFVREVVTAVDVASVQVTRIMIVVPVQYI